MIIINACVLILKAIIILHKISGPRGLVMQVKDSYVWGVIYSPT